MLLGFDHFVVLVNCLDAAMGTYRRLRFDDGTYIELLAFKDAALVAQTFWRDGVKKLQASEGFGGYVLASNNLASDVQGNRIAVEWGSIVLARPQSGRTSSQGSSR